MKYLTQVLAFTRLLVLRRQWKRIQQWLISVQVPQETQLAALVYEEAQHAAKHPAPQFYGSQNVASYSPWGDAADKAFELFSSLDAREQMRGIAMWLAVVYYETRNASIDALRILHVDVAYDFERLRGLRERTLAIQKAA